MPHRAMQASDFEERIQEAEHRRDWALAQYEKAIDELEWWKQGQRLFAGDPEPPQEATLTELFPPAWIFESGVEPTLKQAIVAVMAEVPGKRWPLSELVDKLGERDWLPDRANAGLVSKGVADVAALLASEGHLVRVQRGMYALDAELSASLEAGRKKNFLGREDSAEQA